MMTRKNETRIIYLLLCILTLVLCGCEDTDTAGGQHRLHLTRNTLWDNPVYTEMNVDEFHEYRNSRLGPKLAKFIEQTDSLALENEVLDAMVDSVAKNDVPMKGLLMMFLHNQKLCSLPENDMTRDTLKYYIDRAYDIAERYDSIPQSLFFCFWNNAMIALSNVSAHEDIHREAQKLLRLCKEQNYPIGSIYSYNAVGYCLMDEYDYTMAREQFGEGDKIAERYFPEIIGKNWKEADFTRSEIIAMYVATKLLQLRCSVDGNDTTWIRNNEKELLDLSNRLTDYSHVGAMLCYMAMFYDAVDDDASYEKMIGRMSDFMEKYNMYERKDETSIFYTDCSFYFTARVKHALKKNNAKEAEYYVNLHRDFFERKAPELLAKMYYQQGKYTEALKYLYQFSDRNEERLNGNNRNTLRSMSAVVDDYNNQMLLLRTQINHSRQRMALYGVVLILTVILLLTLGFFYFKQKQHNVKLNHALAKAEKASRAKDIFLNNMSHEIHTPLNHIYGFAQLLADPSLPLDEASTREMAQAICAGSAQLTQILDNVVEVTDKISKLDRLEDVESVLKQTDCSNT